MPQPYSTRLVVERVTHQLRPGRAAGLLLDVRAVRLDRAHAEVELSGDLGVGVAEGDQAQDLELALGQVVRWAGRLRRGGRDLRPELAG